MKFYSCVVLRNKSEDEKIYDFQLMHSKAKQEILDEIEEEKMEIEQKEEKELRKKQKRMQKLAGADLTHSYSMQAAEVFKRVTQGKICLRNFEWIP